VVALAVGGLGSCDLGLIHAQVRSDGGARRVDVGLEAGVDGTGVEVPPVPPTEGRTLIIATMQAWAEHNDAVMADLHV
jgi:hypothetical protein